MPFYHDLALRSKPTTAEIIYCPGVYNPSNAEDARDISGEMGTGKGAVSLGIGPLNQSLSFNTSIEWTGMGSLGDALLQGFVDTLKANKKVLLKALSGMKGFSEFVGWTGGEETAQKIIDRSDAMWSGQQVDYITNQGFTKAYSGSSNSIDIPTIEILLYAKNDSDNILKKLSWIMSYINPKVTNFAADKNYSSNDSSSASSTSTTSSTSSTEKGTRAGGSGNSLNDFLLVEKAPGDYRASNNNFNLNDLQNTFLVRLGYKYIPYCLPVGINIQLSKSGFQYGGGSTWVPHYIRIAIQMQTAFRVLTRDMINIIKSSYPPKL